MTNTKLLALVANPLEAYARKGTLSGFKKYLNPKGIFANAIVAYIHQESGDRVIEGIRAVRVKSALIPFDYLRLLVTCLQICIRERIGIIRAYCAEMPGLVACMLGLLLRIPVVVSVHAFIDDYMKDREYSIIARAIVEIVHRIVYFLSSHVFCVGNGLANHLHSAGVPSEKISVIYNKVDIGKFSDAKSSRGSTRTRMGLTENETILIHVGRLSRDKRIDRIVRAVHVLHNRGVEVKLLIVGTAPGLGLRGIRAIGHNRIEATEEELKKMTHQLGLDRHVRFLGRVSDQELVDVLGASDIYVSASVGEGFGIAIAEAEAVGLPIVATRELMIKNRGMLINARTSLTYSTDNIEELADTLQKLIDCPNLRIQLGLECTREAKKYQWERMELLEAESYGKVIVFEEKKPS